eukprot:11197175-Lingulodinium_polyedra.AAC.1
MPMLMLMLPAFPARPKFWQAQGVGREAGGDGVGDGIGVGDGVGVGIGRATPRCRLRQTHHLARVPQVRAGAPRQVRTAEAIAA